MRMDSEMIGILLSDSMHYTIVVSLEMSDEPTKKREQSYHIAITMLSHCKSIDITLQKHRYYPAKA